MKRSFFKDYVIIWRLDWFVVNCKILNLVHMAQFTEFFLEMQIILYFNIAPSTTAFIGKDFVIKSLVIKEL